ncbi:MAG TPA: DUF2723 domain-containing protein [Alphaproteobacteria bacterium]|nr:DUF2723 domain-containing protein [Alphaproteobacteria bacterium]
MSSGGVPLAPGAFEGDLVRLGHRLRQHRKTLIAIGLFLGFAVYYAIGLYPGIGGTINAGDSAKFQVLGLAQIMVHGPGYPLVLMIGAALRNLQLPIAPWWQVAFVLSALPAAFANAMSFLIAERATGSLRFGVAAALIVGSAHLMAIQATEAEVYALNIAFVLTVIYLLTLFVDTERIGFFVAASAVYAISFGDHLMMVMLLPLFLVLTAFYHRLILRPQPVLAILAFILLGASQYLYLAAVAGDPATRYSEYMPLRPSLGEFLRYILGFYFVKSYGSGLDSWRTLEALGRTFQAAHPWIWAPLLGAGLLAFAAGGRKAPDPAWRRVALLHAGALCFLPFVLWYGVWDIRAFHLPVLALALLAAVASLGWALATRPAALRALGLLLVLVGAVRLAQTGWNLVDRQPALAGLVPAVKAVLAEQPQIPGSHPVLALDYDLRMAVMYHVFAGDLPRGPEYRLSWHVPDNVTVRPAIAGSLIGGRAKEFVRKVRERNPAMACRVSPLAVPDLHHRKAYGFRCDTRPRG